MNKVRIWFLLSVKRQLKRPAVWIILCALPLFLFGLRSAEQADAGKIRIALYAPGEVLSQEIISALENKRGTFEFYGCESSEQMIRAVVSRQAECGYWFYDDLEEKLDRMDYRRSIGVYSAPSTVTASLSTEVVFAALFEAYGKRLLADFAAEELGSTSVLSLYETYLTNGSTFSFVYETLEQETLVADVGKPVFPIRGIVAVYLYVVGLFSAVTLCHDEEKGLFIPVLCHQKIWCRLASMFGALAPAGISALVALWCTDSMSHIGYEVGVMLCYLIAITMFSYCLNRILRSPLLICSLIPVLLLGSLILCPIFVDIGVWIPKLGILAKGFLPYYYLASF